MNADEDYNIATRYRTVRKHLDSLGYRQALSFDALPLIERLLADLLQTTESLKHFKAIAQDNIEACSQLQRVVDPYKCDNTKLVQECNQLHLDLIQAKDSHQKQVRELKRELHNLESEYADFQLGASRNLLRIKELETESSNKSKKILELQGKYNKPIICTTSKKRACYPLRRPVFECDSLPQKKTSSTSLPSLTNVDPTIVDLMSMADHRMNVLNHEVTKLKEELELQTDDVQALNAQLTSKEKEIIRLKKMLEGGRPYSAVVKDCCYRKVDKHCCADGNELRLLQQTKQDLEQQLKEALNKLHDAMSQAMKLAERNEELEKELKDIDHIALAVEADCNSTVKENNRRVSRLQEKLEDVMTQVHILENELTVERREVQELRADLEASKLEKRNIQRVLESTLDEKKQMTDRINRLTVVEKNLNDEIERLTKENEYHKQEIIHLENSKILLEEAKGTQEHSKAKELAASDNSKKLKGKGEKDDKNKGKNGRKKKSASKGRQPSLSPLVQEDNNKQKEYIETAKENEVTRDTNTDYAINDIHRIIDEKEALISSLKHTIERIETEKDYYRNEYNKFREQFNKEKDNADLWAQTCELKRQLNEQEHTVYELQREKKELCREKCNLEAKLKSQSRRTCMSCAPSSPCRHGSCSCPSPLPPNGESVVPKATMECLERERDAARADVERLAEERDALRERLKMTVETHSCETRRLKESLEDAENRLKHFERERQDLLHTQGTRRATISGLEDQLEDAREELRKTKQELAAQRTQYFQLRALQDQTDQALGDVQGQLSQSETELNKALDRNRSMEQHQIHLDNQVMELKQEIANLRTTITHLDHEKDQLLMALDEKTERIANLEREVRSKEQQASEVQQQIRDWEHKYQLCVDQSAEQERQLRSMQLDMENLQRQLTSANLDRENAIQENRRLQDDLAAVTCEVRNLQRELETSRAESYDLKRQLQTYVGEVRRAEELINRKENERTEMLNHFRSLSLEATVLENNNHSLESEAAEARGALQSARDRIMDMERQLADRDCLIRGYETQITELTQSVASMETQLRQQSEQRQRTEADLNAVRDLCVQLDQQKENLLQQMGDKDTIKAQYEAELARLKVEHTMIQDQMGRDHVTVERLETLLGQARQESINCQATNQELQSEMSRLKQKISELQAQLTSESAELRRYQNQAAEYSKQINDLRRQVTNERFDRARLEEENRRDPERGEETGSDPEVKKSRRTKDLEEGECRNACKCQDSGRIPKIGGGKDDDVPCISIILQPDVLVKSCRREVQGGPSASGFYGPPGDSKRPGFPAGTGTFHGRASKEAAGTNAKGIIEDASPDNESRKSAEKNSSTSKQTVSRSLEVAPLASEINSALKRPEESRAPREIAETVEVSAERMEDEKKSSEQKKVKEKQGSGVKDAGLLVLNASEETRADEASCVDEGVQVTTEGNSIIKTERKDAASRGNCLSERIHETIRKLQVDLECTCFKFRNYKPPDSKHHSRDLVIHEGITPSGCSTSEAPVDGGTPGKLDKSINCTNSLHRSDNIKAASNETSTDGCCPDDTLDLLRRAIEAQGALPGGTSGIQGKSLRKTDNEELLQVSFKEINGSQNAASPPESIRSRPEKMTVCDFTRPEFVKMLTEIKEHTENLEKQLAAMNCSIRSRREALSLGKARISRGSVKGMGSYCFLQSREQRSVEGRASCGTASSPSVNFQGSTHSRSTVQVSGYYPSDVRREPIAASTPKRIFTSSDKKITRTSSCTQTASCSRMPYKSVKISEWENTTNPSNIKVVPRSSMKCFGQSSRTDARKKCPTSSAMRAGSRSSLKSSGTCFCFDEHTSRNKEIHSHNASSSQCEASTSRSSPNRCSLRTKSPAPLKRLTVKSGMLADVCTQLSMPCVDVSTSYSSTKYRSLPVSKGPSLSAKPGKLPSIISSRVKSSRNSRIDRSVSTIGYGLQQTCHHKTIQRDSYSMRKVTPMARIRRTLQSSCLRSPSSNKKFRFIRDTGRVVCAVDSCTQTLIVKKVKISPEKIGQQRFPNKLEYSQAMIQTCPRNEQHSPSRVALKGTKTCIYSVPNVKQNLALFKSSQQSGLDLPKEFYCKSRGTLCYKNNFRRNTEERATSTDKSKSISRDKSLQQVITKNNFLNNSASNMNSGNKGTILVTVDLDPTPSSESISKRHIEP
ncbi:centrosomal protein of 135 kDa [Orussus abietinus]|uniref:centrosomal protein of 135 kDa n=1 Tax=Orussus abietinus TaxID=222816 RepID=UPI000C715BA3|nr:centrosomal protein of 135 kDa [Orussus abietinus]